MGLFFMGQRWISETEPELQLRTVVNTGSGRIPMSEDNHENKHLFPVRGDLPLSLSR
jgi:hypothetical protein